MAALYSAAEAGYREELADHLARDEAVLHFPAAIWKRVLLVREVLEEQLLLEAVEEVGK